MAIILRSDEDLSSLCRLSYPLIEYYDPSIIIKTVFNENEYQEMVNYLENLPNGEVIGLDTESSVVMEGMQLLQIATKEVAYVVSLRAFNLGSRLEGSF